VVGNWLILDGNNCESVNIENAGGNYFSGDLEGSFMYEHERPPTFYQFVIKGVL